ncbi:MAG: phenylalanine--tRNA ligase subunit beta [Steroidobacteraceae bacterium]
MKVPLSWLADFVAVPWAARELGSRLTMSGFELESIAAAAPEFAGVVVARIIVAEQHPDAEKLRICRVAVEPNDAFGQLQIVCGAANARAGLKTALAQVGARLPGSLAITAAKLRGVESRGMLCSAKELGLADTSEGILELPSDAPVGQVLRDYLHLADTIIELNVTPNRGDVMSIVGVAREVAALQAVVLEAPIDKTVPVMTDAVHPVVRTASGACPRFVSRVIRGIANRGATPIAIRERLRRAGVRSISPVVDVTNYVLLELGQPMHAYDLDKLRGAIDIRFARAQEPLKLLDGTAVELEPDMLVIADDAGPVGLAGVMGGERTAVSAETRDVLLEVAYFAPAAIAGRGRRLGLVTDASQRFERGVDPAGQLRAMARATELLIQMAGGTAGPVRIDESPEHIPARAEIRLRRKRVTSLLGMTIDDARIERTLRALGMTVVLESDGWRVTPPSWRFDLSIEPDLIEEVARIVGYDQVPQASPRGARALGTLPESRPSERDTLQLLAARGFQEVITFAFVDPALQAKLVPARRAPVLANPIASDLAQMRASLWPGLVKVALENLRRQQDRVRLVEMGAVFSTEGNRTTETEHISGIALGDRYPEQWSGGATVGVDFFDIKRDVEALLATTGEPDAFTFVPADLECLHPGRCAEVLRRGSRVGVLGELHPAVGQGAGFREGRILFELLLGAALSRRLWHSKFASPACAVASLSSWTKTALSAVHERVVLAASKGLCASSGVRFMSRTGNRNR